MFDIGLSELMVIGVVALVVIGPERLPKVARTLGLLFGRLQRYVTQVKSDISREMEMAELGKVKTEFESAARTFQTDIESKASDVSREVQETQTALENAFADSAPPAEATPAEPAPSTPGPARIESSPQLELGIEEPVQPGPKPAG
jgi:sec-independent protein translocase protein TatB